MNNSFAAQQPELVCEWSERNVRFVQEQEWWRESMIWRPWSQSWPANGQRRISQPEIRGSH